MTSYPKLTLDLKYAVISNNIRDFENSYGSSFQGSKSFLQVIRSEEIDRRISHRKLLKI